MKMSITSLACLIGVATLESRRGGGAVMGFSPPSRAIRPTFRPTQLWATTSNADPFHQKRLDFSIFGTFLQDPRTNYAVRQANFDIADKELLTETASYGDAVIVDARSLHEIAKNSLDRPFVHGQFILKTELSHLHQILPSNSAHIIVFSKAGGRAQKVKTTLEENGYTNVLNAGGLEDVDFLP